MSAPALRKSPTRHRGFSFVELIAAITMVMALSIVAIVYGQHYIDLSHNSKRLADVDFLGKTAQTYFAARGTYPDSHANTTYYDDNGTYVHQGDPKAYGASAWADDALFGAEFLRNMPHDPDNNEHYAYGKLVNTESGKGAFDFATVNYKDGIYSSYVRGNYDGVKLTSLVHEYAGPGFLIDGSSEHLPYNPYINNLVGRITNSSGAITVKRGSNVLSDGTSGAYAGEIFPGDIISTGSGAFAVISISDGSEIKLGKRGEPSTLNLEELSYQDNSIITKVKLKLESGELWIKVPKLTGRDAAGSVVSEAERSQMEVETENALAAVRGTVFGITTTGNGGSANTTVTILDGQVALSDATGGNITISGATGGLLTPTESGIGNQTITAPQTATQLTSEQILQALSDTADWHVGTAISGIRPNILGLGYDKPSDTVQVRLSVRSEERGLILCTANSGTTAPSGFLRRPETNTESAERSQETGGALTGFSLYCQNTAFESEGATTRDFSGSLATLDASGQLIMSLRLCEKTIGDTIGKCSSTRNERISQLASVPANALDLSKSDCDPSESFGPFGCIGADTIAYAPFDTPGDLNMYIRNADGTLGKLPVKTNGWKNAEVSTATGSDIFGNSFTYHPDFNPIITGLQNGNIVFTGSENGDGGVIIGRTSGAFSGGYLAYDFAPLNLHYDNFAIEVRVKGSDLLEKAVKGVNVLWKWADIVEEGEKKMYLSKGISTKGGLYLQNSNNFEYQKSCGGPSPDGSSFCPLNLTSYITHPDDFYTLRTSFHNNQAEFSINGQPIGQVKINKMSDIAHKPQIYFGGKNATKNNQWNGPIQSIRIVRVGG